MKNEIQAQNIPRDINPKSPSALKQVIDLAKEMQNQLNELRRRIVELDNKLESLSVFSTKLK